MIDCDYLIEPGTKVRLKKIKTDATGAFKNKEDAADATAKNFLRIGALQELLYADASRAVLVVLQAMDAGGKDGTIEKVFSAVNPQGCAVTSFKVPSSLEKSHDFLWRIHQAAPAKGMLGIFNRSHYESVLVERVRGFAPKDVWKKRYDHINAFENLLADEGTTIVKFFLHISKEEQAKRLQARLDDSSKNWKFNAGDLEERKRWGDYTDAFDDALSLCSTKAAPWYVIPADHKWYRNYAVSHVLVKTMERMKLKFPAPQPGIEKITVV